MKVRLGIFTKDNYSTQLPATGWNYEEFDCHFKGSASITAPTVVLRTDNVNINYNYAYIPMWNRYYYINDIIFNTGNNTDVSLVEDILASHRNEIVNSTEYVARSAKSGIYDLTLSDELAVHNNNIYTQTYRISPLGLSSDGIYIIGIAGLTCNTNDIDGIAGLRYIYMTPDEYKDFIDNCYSAQATAGSDYTKSFWESVFGTDDNIVSNLAQSFFNPLDYVVSIKWFPIDLDPNHTTTESTSIQKSGNAWYVWNPETQSFRKTGVQKNIASADDLPEIPNHYMYYTQDTQKLYWRTVVNNKAIWANCPFANKVEENSSYSVESTKPSSTSGWNTSLPHRWNWNFTQTTDGDNLLSFGFNVWEGLNGDKFSNLDYVGRVIDFSISSDEVRHWAYPLGDEWFVRSNEWSSYSIYIPCFGYIPIDAKYCGQTLNFRIYVDYPSGMGTLEIKLADNTIIDVRKTKFAYDIPLTNLSRDMSSTLNYQNALTSRTSSLVSASANALTSVGKGIVGGVMSGSGIAGAVVGGATGAISSVANLTTTAMSANATVDTMKANLYQDKISPALSVSGGLDERTYIIHNLGVVFVVQKHKVFDNGNYRKKVGGKVMKLLPLNTCIGTTDENSYLQTIGANVAVNGTNAEKLAVNQMLDSGILLM